MFKISRFDHLPHISHKIYKFQPNLQLIKIILIFVDSKSV